MNKRIRKKLSSTSLEIPNCLKGYTYYSAVLVYPDGTNLSPKALVTSLKKESYRSLDFADGYATFGTISLVVNGSGGSGGRPMVYPTKFIVLSDNRSKAVVGFSGGDLPNSELVNAINDGKVYLVFSA